MFEILAADEAREQINIFKSDKGLAKRYKAAKKAVVAITPHP